MTVSATFQIGQWVTVVRPGHMTDGAAGRITRVLHYEDNTGEPRYVVRFEPEFEMYGRTVREATLHAAHLSA